MNKHRYNTLVSIVIRHMKIPQPLSLKFIVAIGEVIVQLIINY